MSDDAGAHDLPVSFADVADAAGRLDGVVHRTPVHASAHVDALTGARVWFKCENFQRVGAFKFRGAFNALSRLSPGQRRAGVLAYSSGNHAQAVALASRLLGVHATIIMPDDAPGPKLQATRGYLDAGDGELVTYDRARTTREELAQQILSDRPLTLIPPYDHPDVIAGQGTAALELFEQVGDLDMLIVPVGGGGLISGSAVAARERCPGCRVIGVEPESADDATRSFRTGRLHTVRDPQTIADGARTPSLGRFTLPIVRRLLADMATVSEGRIARATLLCWERMKLVVEPTGALALAGLLRLAREDPSAVRDRRVGVILSGGNVDPGAVERILALAGRP